MSVYWEKRKHLKYYLQAITYVRRFCPSGGRLLDVGAGVRKGAKYLIHLGSYDRTSIELPDGSDTIPGVRVIEKNFMDWTPDGFYDVALCLQMLEHVKNPRQVCQKLARIAPVLVISVPGLPIPCGEHVRESISQGELDSWLGMKALESVLVGRIRVSAYRRKPKDFTRP